MTYLTKSDWLRSIVTDDVMTQYDLIRLFRYSIHLLIKHIASYNKLTLHVQYMHLT